VNYELERIPCPLCQSTDSRTFRQSKDRLKISDEVFKLVKCADCQLVYQNPRVTPSTIGAFYSSNYWSSRPGRNAAKEDISRKKVTLKCQLLARHAPIPGTLLELGSANGDFLIGMQNLGWDVHGVEVSPDASEFSRKQGMDVFTGDLLGRPDNGTRFDLIVLWAVLPHISNPLETMVYAAQLLAPNGKVVISGANIDGFASRAMGNKWGHLDQPRHYCMWTPVTITKLLKAAGLTVQEVIYHDDIFNSRYVPSWLYPFTSITDDRKGITFKKLVRYSAKQLAKLLSGPILALARLRQDGGIVTIISG
jgi:SAM-dependent methyltransferase